MWIGMELRLAVPGSRAGVVRELGGWGWGWGEDRRSKANEDGAAAVLSFLRRRQIL